jgi:hypothetical protein
MAKPTLEAQATAIRNAMRLGLPVPERKFLEEAERTLRSLIALRKSVLAAATSGTENGPDPSDRLCSEIIKLLDLPALPSGE